MENLATQEEMTPSECMGVGEEYSIGHTHTHTYVTAAYSHGESCDSPKDDTLRMYGSRKGVWGGYN